MTITREDLLGRIVECLNAYIRSPEEKQISERTNPINDLGLESVDGVAFACDLSLALGWEIPSEYNPFVDDETSSARNVGEIADFLLAAIRKETIEP